MVILFLVNCCLVAVLLLDTAVRRFGTGIGRLLDARRAYPHLLAAVGYAATGVAIGYYSLPALAAHL